MQQNKEPAYKQWCRLQTQNYQLRQQLSDLSTKYNNLKKQQQIFSEITKYNHLQQEEFQQQHNQELEVMKEQFVRMVKEKQQQEGWVRELREQNNDLREQIKDLKYTNAEMRLMNEKQERIHQKQIQLREREGGRGDSGRRDSFIDNNSKGIYHTRVKDLERRLLQKEKEVSYLQEELTTIKQTNAKNIQKLQKCSQIAKQMQQHYNKQLQSRQQTITQLEIQLSNYKYHLLPMNLQQHLSSPHTKLPSNLHEDCSSSLKCSSIVSEYHQQETWGQEKCERVVEEMKMTYAREIAMYQEKIRYLTLKVEALQAEKRYLMKSRASSHGDESNIMIDTLQSVQSFNTHLIPTTKPSPKPHPHQQSLNLLNQSKTSAQNDSFTQFTPKSEFSSSLIRENTRQSNNIILRPKLSLVKTPNKSVQKGINAGGGRSSCSYQRVVLGERNQG